MHTLELKKQKVAGTFDRAQFDLLMKCSEKCDMTEWNTWRQQHPNQPVLLQNANIEKAFLRGADLRNADFRGASLRGVDLSGFRLPDYSRRWADLSGANFGGADLWGFLYESILTSVDLHQANRRIKDFTRTGCKYTHKENSLWGSARTFPKAAPGNGFDIATSPQEANQHSDQVTAMILLAA